MARTYLKDVPRDYLRRATFRVTECSYESWESRPTGEYRKAVCRAKEHRELDTRVLGGMRNAGRRNSPEYHPKTRRTRIAVTQSLSTTLHSTVCAASALMRSLHRSRKLRADDFLGQPTYLEPKGEGESSMLAKRGSAKVCSVVVPASPVRMVKLGAPSRAVHVLNPSPTRCQCRPSQHT